MSLIIDIHALQTVPPSLINRDDTGAPKTAVFGGVPRQRVSSQSWKRAIRKYFGEHFDPESIGDRSKRLPEKIARQLVEVTGISQEDAIKRTEQLFSAVKIKTVVEKPKKGDDTEHNPWLQTEYMIFLSPQQIDRAVRELAERDGQKFTKAEATAILDTDHSVDIVMFGRMVANAPDFRIDAAVQVAHAIGVHASAPEFDFYTAVDELAEEGAGMLGTVQMMSSSLYRYATINVDGLKKNLESADAAIKAVEQFIEAFVASMPTGKINTFANQTLPELVYVTVRDTRPVSLVTAFEDAVTATEQLDRRHVAAARLADEARAIQDTYGFVPTSQYVLGLGDIAAPFDGLAERVTLKELGERVAADVATALGDDA